MTLDEYQKKATETAQYPNVGNNYIYPTLGLVGEGGEVANKIKKIQRDKGNILDEEVKKAIANELGDMLWYISQLARELNLSLEEIGDANIEKLRFRKERSVISGDGDNR
ncbi:MAG: nucleoside triphosphate pyrophosphohydrolase family protein [Candidatus Jorgensenbacteria bacterium]|nr:nucleoside triphosphate pyrophosphohydrolase family protein [Candidatus Jorgensenbacteria bacterium]